MSSHKTTKKSPAADPSAALPNDPESLVAVAIVVTPKVDAPAWHLRCPHCHAFALVRVARIPRTPPACDR